jgi:hypothetical protein
MVTGENMEVPEGKPNGRGYRQSLESLERDAQALRLSSMGYSHSQINEQLRFGGVSNVGRALKRARERVLSAPVKQHVATQLAKLDYIGARLIEIMFRQHVVVSGGKIVTDDQGNPLQDAGPELACLRELRSVSESTRKLLGIDAAAKLDVDFGQSEVDASIAQLVSTLESRATAHEQAIRRGDR